VLRKDLGGFFVQKKKSRCLLWLGTLFILFFSQPLQSTPLGLTLLLIGGWLFVAPNLLPKKGDNA
jgi:hypothetical protein